MAIDDGDDLSNDIAAAFKEVETGGATPEPVASPEPVAAADAPKNETASEGADRARDEKGRFAPKVEDEKEAIKPADVNKAAADAEKLLSEAAKGIKPAEEQAKALATQPIPAPLNWGGRGKVDWARLPQTVQKEITNDLQRIGELQARQERLDAVIGPQRAQILTAQYGGVEQGIQQLLALSDMAASNPAGFIQWFAQQRGINLTQPQGQGAAQGDDQPMHQQPNPEAQRIAALEARLNQFLQSQTQGTQVQAQTEVELFASDPSHPYFNDVKVQMGALMHTGRAKTMQEAYDMACWADPDIRETLLSDQRQKIADEEAARVRAAQNAQVSISGSPAGANVPVEESDDDLEALIRKEARNRGLAA